MSSTGTDPLHSKVTSSSISWHSDLSTHSSQVLSPVALSPIVKYKPNLVLESVQSSSPKTDGHVADLPKLNTVSINSNKHLRINSHTKTSKTPAVHDNIVSPPVLHIPPPPKTSPPSIRDHDPKPPVASSLTTYATSSALRQAVLKKKSTSRIVPEVQNVNTSIQ